MTQVWLYSVASSSDPNNINCAVPRRVDDDLIFFGPRKKRMREQLRRRYLTEGCGHCQVADDLYIVGVNGSNRAGRRKIVWDGKLSEVMTFAEADRRLTGAMFAELRGEDRSPLHVCPIYDRAGSLIGYKHSSDLHAEDNEWVRDMVSSRRNVRLDGHRLGLRPNRTAWEAFDRDCCLLLENRFFARWQGIKFDDDALEILRKAQPAKCGIDRYAIFGRAADGQANGLRGSWLGIDGELAKQFVSWLDHARWQLAGVVRTSSAASHCGCGVKRTRRHSKLC